jgi:transcriptional regulator with XRE-family HTH domain
MDAGSNVSNTHLSDWQRTHFRHWLQNRFTARCQKNSRYSLRSFARTLGLDASTVSQFLSGKRAPSKKSALAICEKLEATPKDLRVLGMLGGAGREPDDFHSLAEDTFAVLADWYHFALLELTFTAGCQSDAAWMARELGLPVQEAKTALERLTRLGLLEKKNGKFRKTRESITNHTGIQTSAARKKLQKQILSKALEAIDEVPQEEKDITSMTMAIDPKNLDRAREMIKKFRRDLCALLEDGQPARVFNLAIQLYPVSKGKTHA